MFQRKQEVGEGKAELHCNRVEKQDGGERVKSGQIQKP
jgi:hypothetical protein